MKTQPSIILDGPLADDVVGHSILPAASYTDPAYLEEESQHIFRSGWTWAGFSHWVADPGDVRPIQVAGRPLLLVRDGEGAVRVFHNACRHRGMQLTDVPQQNRKRIQCAYHCWAFKLDGSLANTPFYTRERGGSMPEELRSRLSLMPVACH